MLKLERLHREKLVSSTDPEVFINYLPWFATPLIRIACTVRAESVKRNIKLIIGTLMVIK